MAQLRSDKNIHVDLSGHICEVKRPTVAKIMCICRRHEAVAGGIISQHMGINSRHSFWQSTVRIMMWILGTIRIAPIAAYIY